MPSRTQDLKITCDVGGTFTDVVVSDQAGELAVGKALSTPPKLVEGLLAAIGNAAAQLDLRPEEALAACGVFVYSTTQATNAILVGKTARTALLVTEGFPDTLVRREGGSMHPYDFSIPYPEPYIPKRLTFEIPERISSEGQVLRALDQDRAREIVRELAAYEVEAVAVCLLWSTANAEHERRLGELVEAELPGMAYTLSHRLNPVVREYRRASGTAIDASLKKLMQGHLGEVERGLAESGFAGELLAATSIGGAMPMQDLNERPIYAAKSGPSLAPIAGQLYCGLLDSPDLIVCDTGGTSFDVSLIRDGALVSTRETWLGGYLTGHITGLSSVDVRSIGAGGGSIAWLDSGGLLRVGPDSAGADPGPACYGMGGDRPTVTDAALLLRYLDPDHFLGGRMKLDLAAAEAAMDRLAGELGQDRIKTAEAVMTVAEQHMVDAIKEITVNQGIDPRRSAIVAGGGAAGLNIASIAEDLGCTRVLLPRAAGALSAFGGQHSDIVIEQGQSAHTYSDDFDLAQVNSALTQIDEQLAPFAAALAEKGVTEWRIEHSVEARYAHQVWSLEIPLNFERFEGAAEVERLSEDFHATHQRIFAVSEPGQRVELVHCQGRLVASPAKPPLRPGSGEPNREGDGTRDAVFRGHGELRAEIRTGAGLTPGDEITGPVLVVEPTTTLVVPPGWRLEVTDAGDYLMELEQ